MELMYVIKILTSDLPLFYYFIIWMTAPWNANMNTVKQRSIYKVRVSVQKGHHQDVQKYQHIYKECKCILS